LALAVLVGQPLAVHHLVLMVAIPLFTQLLQMVEAAEAVLLKQPTLTVEQVVLAVVVEMLTTFFL
jgi:hypothetical protein